MHIETTINSVKVTFSLQKHKAATTDVGVNVGVKLTQTQSKVLELIKRNPFFLLLPKRQKERPKPYENWE